MVEMLDSLKIEHFKNIADTDFSGDTEKINLS